MRDDLGSPQKTKKSCYCMTLGKVSSTSTRGCACAGCAYKRQQKRNWYYKKVGKPQKHLPEIAEIEAEMDAQIDDEEAEFEAGPKPKPPVRPDGYSAAQKRLMMSGGNNSGAAS